MEFSVAWKKYKRYPEKDYILYFHDIKTNSVLFLCPLRLIIPSYCCQKAIHITCVMWPQHIWRLKVCKCILWNSRDALWSAGLPELLEKAATPWTLSARRPRRRTLRRKWPTVRFYGMWAHLQANLCWFTCLWVWLPELPPQAARWGQCAAQGMQRDFTPNGRAQKGTRTSF